MKRHLFLAAQHAALKIQREYDELEGIKGFDPEAIKILKTYPKKELGILDQATKIILNLLVQDRHDIESSEFSSKAAKIGFSRSHKGSCESLVFIGENFVVKSGYSVGTKPKAAIPTFEFKDSWVIQPRCEVYTELSAERKKQLVKEGIADSYGWLQIAGAGRDAHSGNWGILNGKYVQHDW